MPDWAGDRGVLGKLKRLRGKEAHLCHPIQWEESVQTSVDDLDGVLLKVTPYKESEGVVSGVEFLRALYEKFTRAINSFEIWFDEGNIHFYIYAANEDAADKVRRALRGSYPNAQVTTLEGGPAHPEINPDDWVAGSNILKEDPMDWLPIRRYDDDEWEHDDPYTQVLGQLLGSKGTRVMIQGVMRAVPKEWADQVHAEARELETPDVKGWTQSTIREIPPTETEEKQAEIIREQHRKPAFETNLRVLAVAESPTEAANRAQGVGGSYSTYYDTQAEQGLEPQPVTARTQWQQRRKMKKHIENIRYRKLDPEHSFRMTFKEAGGAFHIPSGDIPTQDIEWKRTRSGGNIPTGAPNPDEGRA